MVNKPSEIIETKLVRHKFNPGKMGRQLLAGGIRDFFHKFSSDGSISLRHSSLLRFSL
jgi:hypothetical protein